MDVFLRDKLATGIVVYLVYAAFEIWLGVVVSVTHFRTPLWFALLLASICLAYVGRAMYYWVFDFEKFEEIVDFGDPIPINVRGRFP
jgi:hypothetical protein